MRKEKSKPSEPERFELTVPAEGVSRMAPIGPEQLAIRQPGTLQFLTSAPATNLDISTEAGRISAYNLSVMQGPNVSDLGGAPVEAVCYCITPAEEVDEDTGEVRSYFRLTFGTADGNAVSTTSETVIRRMSLFLGTVGDGPWDPPVRIRLTERKSRRSGRTYHELTILPRGGE